MLAFVLVFIFNVSNGNFHLAFVPWNLKNIKQLRRNLEYFSSYPTVKIISGTPSCNRMRTIIGALQQWKTTFNANVLKFHTHDYLISSMHLRGEINISTFQIY